jgi:hypothetical protein
LTIVSSVSVDINKAVFNFFYQSYKEMLFSVCI